MGAIIVFGSSGFIGKNLKSKLNYINRTIYFPSRKECNLLSREKTNNFFIKHKPEYVIQLAGDVGGIKYIMSNPASTFNNNLKMTSILFEVCQINKVKKIIILNSINIYPKFLKAPFKEHDLFKGDPDESIGSYGLAKKVSLYYSKFYYQQFGLNSINLICDNVYGPYDNFDKEKSRVIPANIVKINLAKKQNKPYIDCWGSGSSLRSFIHVDDVCNAIIYFLDKSCKYDFINLGNENLITIKDLIDKICLILSYNGQIRWDSSKPEGRLRRYMNLEKLKGYRYKTRVNIDRGLEKTIKWYKKVDKFSL